MSVQATGMGAPSTAIVVEELVALGAKYIIRVGLSAEPNSKSSPPGTAGITARAVKPCDLIIAQGSNPNDGTTRHYLPRVKVRCQCKSPFRIAWGVGFTTPKKNHENRSSPSSTFSCCPLSIAL